jgi:hypothetical protein
MAWIESHQSLGHHPKTVRLAQELNCSVPCAIGYLQLFWWWALDYAADGRVLASDALAIEAACMWHRKPNESRSNPLPSRFLSGLEASLFLDQSGLDGVFNIHDWMDYAGRLVERRAANASRMRTRRATHVQDTFSARDEHVQGLPYTTVPTVPTVPDQPIPPNPPFAPSEEGACCQFAELTKGERHAKSCPHAVPA